MESSVLITLIICVTIIVVCAIVSFTKGRSDTAQKLIDIRKAVTNFKDAYIMQDRETGEVACTADYDAILSMLNLITYIS